MNEALRAAVSDAVEFLVALQREGTRPREARTQLQALRQRHAALQIDMLAEEVAYDQTVHYDALLRSAGEGTASVSYCPERAVPWPLRGVHRWSERELVRVNQNVLQVDTAIACLDFIWEEGRTIERLVNVCLIQEELERSPLELTDAELQAAMDRFRASKGLFKVEDTQRWLEQHGMTQEKLERYVAEKAIVPKLRDRLVAGQVDAYFAEHRADFDTLHIARLELADEAQARQLASQLRAGELSFAAAAERVFLDSAQQGQPAQTAVFATIERRSAEPALREALFTAERGQWLGPIPVDARHCLVRVLQFAPAELDGRTIAAIKETLFDAWLTRQRRAARIEWCWGESATTANQGQ